MPNELQSAKGSDQQIRALRSRGVLSTPSAPAMAGAAIVLIALGTFAALLPAIAYARWHDLVAMLLVAAGATEFMAGYYRPSSRLASIAPGFLTAIVGVFLLQDGYQGLYSLSWLITAWLLLRAILSSWAGIAARGSIRVWSLLSAVKDVMLAGFLVIGLSSMTLPEILFQPDQHLAIGLATSLALSFMLTAMVVVEVVYCDFPVEGASSRD